jgi:hypothetical protein
VAWAAASSDCCSLLAFHSATTEKQRSDGPSKQKQKQTQKQAASAVVGVYR